VHATEIQAPVALLLDPVLTPAAKLLYLTREADKTRLAARSGLTYVTIRKALAQLEQHSPPTSGPTVPIPADLLTHPTLRPQAKLLYGLLQTLPKRAFTYSTLAAHARLSPNTARQNINDLAEKGWIQTTQKTRLAQVEFTLHTPDQTKAAAAKQRIKDALNKGEAILREWLRLLVAPTEYKYNARPDFLVNPLSGIPLELDIYFYTAAVAFEFDGPQHTITTERFPSKEELAEQQARDLIKDSLCARHHIKLIRITADDLTLSALQARIGALLPLRDLTGCHHQIAALEKESKKYRRAPQNARR
jgi:DNA-binding transcriptional regulator YhcF (GntR family)